jgi:rhodanese-related sulfurtransferase
MNTNISVTQLKSRLDAGENLQLIDVRSPGEFATGHVPGAINIPLEQIETRLADMGTQPIAVLCQSGRRAGMACESLANLQRDAFVVEGGTQAWIQAGNSVVASTSGKWSLERQVRLIAGMMILLGTVLSVVAAPGWVFLAMFVGAGLTFAGLTDICGMGMILAKLPWNRPLPPCSVKPQEAK